MKYALYGLTLDSELPLDGIDTSNRPADARLRFGETPLRLESPRASGPWGDANPGRVLLRIGDIARFLVVDGREILATPLKDSTPAELGFFLMQGSSAYCCTSEGFCRCTRRRFRSAAAP